MQPARLDEITELVEVIRALVDVGQGGTELSYQPKVRDWIYHNFSELAVLLRDESRPLRQRLEATNLTASAAVRHLTDFIADDEHPVLKPIFRVYKLTDAPLRET